MQRLGPHAEVMAESARVLQALSLLPLAQTLAAERHQLMRVLTVGVCEAAEFDRALDTALDTAHELGRLVGPLCDPTASLKAGFTLGVCFERMGDP